MSDKPALNYSRSYGKAVGMLKKLYSKRENLQPADWQAVRIFLDSADAELARETRAATKSSGKGCDW